MFSFHPELFDDRTKAMEALAAAGFDWFVHYSAIDLIHDQYGLEVCGIPDEKDAETIQKIMRRTFPHWRYTRIYYHDYTRDRGWKVEIYKQPNGGGSWKTA
jgi:hypothetical protein